jgi:hypothetical protein
MNGIWRGVDRGKMSAEPFHGRSGHSVVFFIVCKIRINPGSVRGENI